VHTVPPLQLLIGCVRLCACVCRVCRACVVCRVDYRLWRGG
jgi:hypothetical protein